MAATCPACSAVIAVDDLNIAEGVGLCRACGKVYKLSELAHDPEVAKAELELREGKIPSGCRVDDNEPGVIRVRVSARSIPTALFFTIFATFWNSIVTVFLVIGFTSIFSSPPPAEPSANSTNGAQVTPESINSTSEAGAAPSATQSADSRRSSGKPSGGGNITGPLTGGGILLFMIPFVLVGIGTACVAIVSWAGEVRVTIGDRTDHDSATVFLGLKNLGWKRRFKPSAVKSVTIGDSGVSVNNRPQPGIIIQTDKPLKFGSMLADDRRRWMAATLRVLLLPTGGPNRNS